MKNITTTNLSAAMRREPNNAGQDWRNIDVGIAHHGTKIVLPNSPVPMDYDAGIDILKRAKEQDAQEFDTKEVVGGAPWDALIALNRAMKMIYGVVLAQSIQTFFGPIKPDLVSIVSSANGDITQAIFGQMSLPGIKNPVMIGMTKGGAFITGSVNRAEKQTLLEIANQARELLRSDSIYRGKAIRLLVDEGGNILLESPPQFIDTSKIDESDMLHPAVVSRQISINMLSPLRNADACRRHQIPLKRGILLEGKYGTGKTLTSLVTARVATDNGWTYLVLDRCQGLKEAIEFARNYQPCVIFAEDIDRNADRADEQVNDLVNLLDGSTTKGMEMMVVLTTNFVENIDKALLRPGRLDCIISLAPPDGETVERLIRFYARDLIDADTDISQVGTMLAGQIPATIREVVERAKLSMLLEGTESVSADDLMAAGAGMKRHMELLEEGGHEDTLADRFFNTFKEVVRAAEYSSDGEVASPDDVKEAEGRLARHISSHTYSLTALGRASAGSAEKAAKNTERLLNMTVGEDDELAAALKRVSGAR